METQKQNIKNANVKSISVHSMKKADIITLLYAVDEDHKEEIKELKRMVDVWKSSNTENIKLLQHVRELNRELKEQIEIEED